MPVHSGQLTAGTIALQIDGSSASYYRLHIHNDDPQSNLYLGGPDVTTSNGLLLAKQDTTELMLAPNDAIWIVSGTDNHPVSYLKLT
jgi:hypothetical protein